MADLRGANLEEAKLTGADLSNSYVSYADFMKTDLRGARLAGALDLSEARMRLACTDEETVLPRLLDEERRTWPEGQCDLLIARWRGVVADVRDLKAEP